MSIDRDEKEKKLRLVEIVREAIRRDEALREKYQIGEKFRFVRDRLQVVLEQLEKHIDTMKTEEKKVVEGALSDEVLVFVYLYNTQGLVLQTWFNMVTPKRFYEYSVNRPIYLERAHVESLVRSKSNKSQHAFLTFAAKQVDIVQSEDSPKDVLGNRVVKVRDGALSAEKFISFTHNEQDYVINEQGTLTKKLDQK